MSPRHCTGSQLTGAWIVKAQVRWGDAHQFAHIIGGVKSVNGASRDALPSETETETPLADGSPQRLLQASE
jgi:hypothetical protein